MNYQEDMKIDENSLDLEWLGQAELALKYGKHWAKCQRELTLADEKIKLIRAELIAQANENPEKYLGPDTKPTVANIESYYRNHKRHKEAKDEWVEAQYQCNVAEIAKSEISFTRKAALENLVTLHGQNYFAGPSVPRNLTSERKKKQLEKLEKSRNIGRRLKRN